MLAEGRGNGAMDLREGGEFAGYRVVRKLGAGGMGQVWLVENPNLRRLEAMKVVSTSGAGDDFARRFTTEAQTAAGLDHPNIVTVYAYGIESDAAWFTMSHLEGEDLVRAGALPPAEVATIVERVADAVD
ncbi:hypothetical protein AXK60_18705 [Tsukamurella pseudospumae]|uniref:non-specific serine/threonine protein kinase n=1 Tax=Tsukamurella pseudospumae TaxID=239498 RepID=A0A138A085_9ACTN|nr:hypothetical protein AXK60_18705 [Tsukamurella pseudospumae]